MRLALSSFIVISPGRAAAPNWRPPQPHFSEAALLLSTIGMIRDFPPLPSFLRGRPFALRAPAGRLLKMSASVVFSRIWAAALRTYRNTL
jgi:hypothetical protein